jgi:ADP-heptose:LPS heptosyltransferase
MGDTGTALRVGLVWKGNPRFENDADRSLRSLRDLAPLGEQSGIRYFSLQKGAGEDETASAVAPFPITALGADIVDFSDTAAIMMNLDLVIAVDTAAAHLAGALGRRCWVMLPDYKTDWRWLAERTDSPWYPEVMRLFRQDSSGTWEPVIAEIKNALTELVKHLG